MWVHSRCNKDIQKYKGYRFFLIKTYKVTDYKHWLSLFEYKIFVSTQMQKQLR